MSIFLPHYHSSSRSGSCRVSLRTFFKGACRKAGFTLIELMVVIAILGTFAGIVLISVSRAHTKSRDTQRFKDLETIQGAVEQYYADQGHYPITNNLYASFDAPVYRDTPIIGNTATPNTLSTALRELLPTPPKDPSGPFSSGNDSGYLYKSDATGSNYCIMIWRTPENLKNFSTEYIDMNRCVGVGSDGQCSSGRGNNNIYYSSSHAAGC